MNLSISTSSSGTASSPEVAGSATRLRSKSRGVLVTMLLVCLMVVASVTLAREESSERTRRHWLVTEDGQRIPTRGEWKVDGGRILYTSETGVLAMIRLSSVDLEASEKASQPPPPPEASEPAPKPRPVLVLESKDVAQYEGAVAGSEELAASTRAATDSADDAPESSDAESADEAQTETDSASEDDASETSETAESARRARPSNLTVVSERDLGDFDKGVRLYGTLRNDGVANAFNIRLTVRLLDEVGELVQEGEATIASRQVAPGDSTNFRITFPQVSRYSSIEYDVRSN